MYWIKIKDKVINLERAIEITLQDENRSSINFWFAGEQFPTRVDFPDKESRDKAYVELAARFVDMSF